MKRIVQEELKLLEEELKKSNVATDINLKKRVYEILSDIQYGANQGHYPRSGMLIVLGYNHNSLYYSEPDKTQNIFQDKPHTMTEGAKKRIKSTKNFDGAILINPQGYVTDSGIYLRNIDPVAVLEDMGIENDKDLSSRFGFIDKVHARNLIGISASYIMEGTTTYALSQETGVIRVFEKGKILYSQISKEMLPLELQVLATQ